VHGWDDRSRRHRESGERPGRRADDRTACGTDATSTLRGGGKTKKTYGRTHPYKAQQFVTVPIGERWPARKCPHQDCPFRATGRGAAFDITTHTREGHGPNMLLFTPTPTRPGGTLNRKGRNLCPWIAMFYALLKSPAYALQVVGANLSMACTYRCLGALPLPNEDGANRIRDNIGDFLHHPMDQVLVRHLLSVLGAQGSTVNPDDLYGMIKTHFPKLYNTQAHFSVVYNVVQSSCSLVLPHIGAFYDRSKDCGTHSYPLTAERRPSITASKGAHPLEQLRTYTGDRGRRGHRTPRDWTAVQADIGTLAQRPNRGRRPLHRAGC
jgi:hypothetical protein